MGGGEGEANNENDLILLDAVVVGHWQSLTLDKMPNGLWLIVVEWIAVCTSSFIALERES